MHSRFLVIGSIALGFGSALIAAPQAAADVMTLSSDNGDTVADARLRLYDGDNEASATGGEETNANVGTVAYTTDSGDHYYYDRVAIRFDLSSIPDEATINSATLSLAKHNTNNDATLRVFRLKESFDVSEVSWKNRSNNTQWTDYSTSDRDQTRADTATDSKLFDTGANTYLDLDVTSDVKKYQDGTYQNDGWDVLGPENEPKANGDPPDVNVVNVLLSEEDESGPNESLAPKLTVDYSPIPEPGSLALLGVGAGMMLLGRSAGTSKSEQ